MRSLLFLLCLPLLVRCVPRYPVSTPKSVEGLNKLASFFFDPVDISTRGLEYPYYGMYMDMLALDGVNRDEFDTWDKQDRAAYVQTLLKSRTVSGSTNALYFGQFIDKLSTGQCTKIMILGGSLSCGLALDTEIEKSYPQLLEDLINLMFPCFEVEPNSTVSLFDKPKQIEVPPQKLIRHTFDNFENRTQGRHTIVNRCERGSGSTYFSTGFDGFVCHQKNEIDLVIMEFVSNDLEENNVFSHAYEKNLEESAPKYIEYLIRRLDRLNIPQLFLAGSFRIPSELHRGQDPVLRSAEALHLLVQKHLDIPTVSFPAIFREKFLETWFDETSKYCFNYFMFDYHSHLHGLGHYMITYLLLWNFQNDVHNWAARDSPMERIELEKIPFHKMDDSYWTLLANSGLEAQYDYTSAYSEHSNIVHTSEWEFTDEGRGKYGLVSETPGSRINVKFSRPDFYVANIAFLRSYENMGKFKLTFHVNESLGQNSEVCQVGGNDLSIRLMDCQIYEVDSLWASQTSQSFPVLLKIPEGSHSMDIEVLDVPSEHEQRHKTDDPSSVASIVTRGKKVKILMISLYVERETCKADGPWPGPKERLPHQHLPTVVHPFGPQEISQEIHRRNRSQITEASFHEVREKPRPLLEELKPLEEANQFILHFKPLIGTKRLREIVENFRSLRASRHLVFLLSALGIWMLSGLVFCVVSRFVRNKELKESYKEA
jgi:hypothetical protein